MSFIIEYKGYELHQPNTGGKAGKGKNKTSTIQVQQKMGMRRMVVKAIRFNMDAIGINRQAAIVKAKNWIDAK